MKVICTPKRREWLGPGDGGVGKKKGERPTESRSRAHVLYRVWKEVFARLPTVSWFGACEDFLPGAVQYITVPTGCEMYNNNNSNSNIRT